MDSKTKAAVEVVQREIYKDIGGFEAEVVLFSDGTGMFTERDVETTTFAQLCEQSHSQGKKRAEITESVHVSH